VTWPAAHGDDIYAEADSEPDTLANLGPLRPLAGIWEGTVGADDHPVAKGTELQEYVEHYELQPIDRQTNGPQLFYGLRYHTHIVKPGEAELFHDQVGYWLWEQAAFHTASFSVRVTVNADGSWSYDEEAVLEIPGRADPYRHTDRNTLTMVAGPTPNSLARLASASSRAVGNPKRDPRADPGSGSRAVLGPVVGESDRGVGRVDLHG